MTPSSTLSSVEPEPGRGPAAPPLWYLALTAALCGALVMVIEVLGSRVIGPFFGVSLFVWTSLITVTMVALAAGYWVGGLLSASQRRIDLLFGVIVAAGVGALLVPLLKKAVLTAALGLGLRGGALASALALFGPSLLLLGCVSPLLVKIAARDLGTIGRTVGLLYALSTLGSVAGTVITGFVLIAWIGVDRIFLLTGGALLLLGCSWFLVARRVWAAALLIALAPLAWWAAATPAAVTAASGAVSVHREETSYGTLRVIDRVSGAAHARELRIEGQVQGAIDLRNGLPLSLIMYFLEFLPWGVSPGGEDCLVVGLGAGVVPRWYEARGVRTDVVEINPAVARVAREQFGFPADAAVTIADAREFLMRPGKAYDYLILDIFNGDTTPDHVLSIEALRLARSRLSPRGVLAMNVAGSLRHETLMTASLLRTLREVFSTVECFPLFDADAEPGWGNMVILAYDFPAPAARAYAPWSLSVHPEIYPLVARHLRPAYALPSNTPALVLTDDYNPFDVRDLWLKEQARLEVLRTTEPEFLL